MLVNEYPIPLKKGYSENIRRNMITGIRRRYGRVLLFRRL
jgi:hypothetical protein